MQKYIGVKIVEAEPQSKDGKEGFRVVYEEGYESWCPEDVFLKHNRPVEDMPFSFAIEAAKQGKKIARKGWNGKDQFVYFQPGSLMERGKARNLPLHQWMTETGVDEIEIWGHFDIKTSNGKIQCGWLATQSDMQASDWFIVE
jgi:hypothetical protein